MKTSMVELVEIESNIANIAMLISRISEHPKRQKPSSDPKTCHLNHTEGHPFCRSGPLSLIVHFVGYQSDSG